MGVPLGAQDSVGEASGGLDAVPVGLRCRAADLLAFTQALVCVGEGVQPGQSVLESEVVGAVQACRGVGERREGRVPHSEDLVSLAAKPAPAPRAIRPGRR